MFQWRSVNSTMKMDKHTVEMVIVNACAPQFTDGQMRADEYSAKTLVYCRSHCFYLLDSSKCCRHQISVSVCRSCFTGFGAVHTSAGGG